jgi:hypothetical protein
VVQPRAPPQSWVKINTNASFHESTGAASACVIIIDPAGKPLLSAWWVLRHCSSAEEAETEACLDGVHLAAEWVRQPAIVESDCLTIIAHYNEVLIVDDRVQECC